MIYYQLLLHIHEDIPIGTYGMMEESHQGYYHYKQDKEDIIPDPLFPYPEPPVLDL